MAYTQFKALLKKINLKPKGVKEIVLEVSDGELYGKIDQLDEMLDSRVSIDIDAQSVRYSVEVHAKTKEPIRTYTVDPHGVVTEVKPEGEQAELDLGIPNPSAPIVEIPEEISRETVDAFIMEMLSPTFEDLNYPFHAWVLRLHQGDTYLKIAQENSMASGELVELIDEYRSRVAPLAAQWDEWRKSQPSTPPAQEQKPSAEDPNDEPDDADGAGEVDPPDSTDEDIELEDGDEPEETADEAPEGPVGGADDELSDWEQEIMEGKEPQPADQQPADQPPAPPQEEEQRKELTTQEIEEIILRDRPQFPESTIDFPTILQRRRQSGETWMQIAGSMGMTSGKMSAEWTKYKKLVAKQYGA